MIVLSVEKFINFSIQLKYMSKVVHILPVGMNKELIIESIKRGGYPIQKVYLVLPSDGSFSGGEDILKNAEEIEKTLSVLVEVEKIYVDVLDVYGSALEILKAIKKEYNEGNEVLINATDSARTLTISCYVAAQISGSRLYIALPRYVEGKEAGVERIVEIPIPPLKKITDDKVEIIKVIESQGGEVESINKLIELIEGKITDQKKYMAQRARMSYHLKGLEEDGIVEMKREGKNVRIRLTELGRAYALMH
jgi:DNA-binding transcriptional ArsR family regulator